jgi:hypothetical protein
MTTPASPTAKTPNWRRITTDPPPEGVVVMTKIDDEYGSRNEQSLVLLRKHGLWFTPDRSMYVYYTPTHWSPQP